MQISKKEVDLHDMGSYPKNIWWKHRWHNNMCIIFCKKKKMYEQKNLEGYMLTVNSGYPCGKILMRLGGGETFAILDTPRCLQ